MSEHLTPLLRRLENATAANRVPWQEGASDREFVASFSNSSLRFFPYRDPHEQVDGLSLQIMDADGKLVDELSLDCDHEDYYTLKALYDAARRKARNADDVVRGLLEELG